LYNCGTLAVWAAQCAVGVVQQLVFIEPRIAGIAYEISAYFDDAVLQVFSKLPYFFLHSFILGSQASVGAAVLWIQDSGCTPDGSAPSFSRRTPETCVKDVTGQHQFATSWYTLRDTLMTLLVR
jgi:hypothetical protein